MCTYFLCVYIYPSVRSRPPRLPPPRECPRLAQRDARPRPSGDTARHSLSLVCAWSRTSRRPRRRAAARERSSGSGVRAPRVQRLCCIVAAGGKARGCSEFRETSSLPSWPQPHHTATGCPRCHRRASRRATSWTCPCPHNCSRGAASGRSTQRPPALSGRGEGSHARGGDR